MSKSTPHIPTSGVSLPFAAIVLAMLPAVLDQTILATALPVIAVTWNCTMRAVRAPVVLAGGVRGGSARLTSKD